MSQHAEEASPVTARNMVRLMGVAVTGLGLFFAAHVFLLVQGIFEDPHRLGSMIGAWAEALGGESATVTVEGKPVSIAKPAAAGMLGVGMLIAGWMSLGMVSTGARILLCSDRPRRMQESSSAEGSVDPSVDMEEDLADRQVV